MANRTQWPEIAAFRRKSGWRVVQLLRAVASPVTMHAMGAAKRYLKVFVVPGSRHDAIELNEDAGRARIRVVSRADRGDANEAVVRVLADRLARPKTGVTIVSGMKARKN
jgi:uncharacterized protein YggU (UPF0235/DUF167 family)